MFRSLMMLCYLVACGVMSVRVADAQDVWPGFRGRGDSQVPVIQAPAGQIPANPEAGNRVSPNQVSPSKLPWAWEARGRSPGNWNIRLKGYGQSSPVVWGETIYVTAISGEMKEHLHLFAIKLSDGELLWEREFSATQMVKESDTVSRGAPTPVVDAKRVYAVFESGDVFALDHAGELQWERSFVKDYGEFKGPHGYASSPVLVDDLCIIQVAQSGPSYILALDQATGLNRWKVDHPSQTGWSSPAIYRGEAGPQIIISTAGSVRALDAGSGATRWVSEEIQGNSTASPTIAGNLVVIGAATERGGGGGGNRRAATPPTDAAASPASAAATTTPQPSTTPEGSTPPGVERRAAPSAAPTGSGVLRLDGDATREDRLVWKSPQVSAGYASPVVVGDFAYFVNRVGVATCARLSDGQVQWQHRLPGEVWASPVANNGHVTFFGKFGFVVTLQGGPKVVEVAESNISTTEVVYGVAAAGNSWIVRTGRGLMRISQPTEEAAN
ncbi:MAG: pyrrolo-quinoline quinone [Planctomyces sp.]|nr:pyrrolo-quinoline quinone [Planctomyces sp.]